MSFNKKSLIWLLLPLNVGNVSAEIITSNHNKISKNIYEVALGPAHSDLMAYSSQYNLWETYHDPFAKKHEDNHDLISRWEEKAPDYNNPVCHTPSEPGCAGMYYNGVKVKDIFAIHEFEKKYGCLHGYKYPVKDFSRGISWNNIHGCHAPW